MLRNKVQEMKKKPTPVRDETRETMSDEMIKVLKKKKSREYKDIRQKLTTSTTSRPGRSV